jgi:hypothetical protein
MFHFDSGYTYHLSHVAYTNTHHCHHSLLTHSLFPVWYTDMLQDKSRKSKRYVGYRLQARADLASSARRGGSFPWGGARGSLTAHSPLQSATLPLALFEMAESASLPFCYILHYLWFIKFISAFITYA